MRIALVTRGAWPRLGGIEVLVRTAAHALAQQNDVEVFAQRIEGGVRWSGPLDRTEPFEPFTDPESGVTTTQLRLSTLELVWLAPFVFGPKRVGSRVRTLHRASSALEQWHARVTSRRFAAALEGADVIHRFSGNRMALATVRAARRLGRPVVITPLAHPGQWDDDEISALAYREADLVVATSAVDAAVYERLGVEPARLRICPLPTRAPQRGGGMRLRQAAGITGPLILFLGARREYKGVGQLLSAASILLRKAPSVQVAFVGPGARLPAAANLLDVGVVDDQQRDAWLDAADIVCLPSLNESFALAVSEAWSVGAPVVTSDIPIFRERVEGVGGGLAVPAASSDIADALLTLLRDDRLRKRMGQAGLDHYQQKLSEAAFASWHQAAYQRLLSR